MVIIIIIIIIIVVSICIISVMLTWNVETALPLNAHGRQMTSALILIYSLDIRSRLIIC